MDRPVVKERTPYSERGLGLHQGSPRLELDAAKSQVVSFDDGVPFLGETVTSLTSPGRLALSHPYQTTVYVDRPGTLLRSRGDRLLVEHGEKRSSG